MLSSNPKSTAADLSRAAAVERSINEAPALQGVVNDPTPGNSAPATSGGTLNNAQVPFFPSNWVDSYVTTDTVTGAILEVNLTRTGSAFGPGYVARTVTNGVAHAYGEGLSPWQSNWLAGLLGEYIADQIVWGSQLNRVIDNAKLKSCNCTN